MLHTEPCANVWNENNYDNVKNILKFLSDEYVIEYKTIGDLIWKLSLTSYQPLVNIILNESNFYYN